MSALLKKPLFWTNLAALTFAGWLIASLVFGWTNPAQNPPGGTGTLSALSGNAGVGTPSPADKLDVVGNVRWTGTLTNGSVPWARLTAFPIACPAGQFVKQVGSSLTCATPTVTGGLTGSGTAGFLAQWTGATSLGNAAGISTSGGNLTVTGTITGGNLTTGGNITGGNVTSNGDLTANNNTWGTQSTSNTGTNGTSNFGAWGAASPWSLTCPTGMFAIGLDQTSSYGGARLKCAKP